MTSVVTVLVVFSHTRITTILIQNSDVLEAKDVVVKNFLPFLELMYATFVVKFTSQSVGPCFYRDTTF